MSAILKQMERSANQIIALDFMKNHRDFFQHWKFANGDYSLEAYDWCYRWFELLEVKDE